MAEGTSILVRARTEGSLTAPPVGSPRVPTGVGPRPAADDTAVPTDVNAPELQELGEVFALLANQPPPNVAFLHIQAHALDNDPRRFSPLGASSVRNLFPEQASKSRGRPKLVLATLAQDVNPATSLMPSRILGLMHEFTKENRDVAWWINDLRAAFDDDLHVVIVDHTGFEIPWELLTLPASESKPKTYLGAAVSTVRWQDIYDDRTLTDRLLQVEEEEHIGHIAAFVDVQGLKGGGTETGILAELRATVEPDLKRLEERLTRPEVGFGLIYLACHGHSAPNPWKFALGSPTEAGERLELGALHGTELHLFEQSKAVVFINACHSGRMLKEDEYLGAEHLRGFPEFFLGQGAVGVIGTTGFVNDKFAAKMANWLLRNLRTTDEPVSKLLRRWRATVIESLPLTPSEEDKVELLNAFMYVYYGNPLSRLRIVEGP
jgi:hypothetical protein